MQIVNKWIETATSVMCKEIFDEPKLVDQIHLSYGFPSHRAFSEKRKVVGESWETSEGVRAIIISATQFVPDNYPLVLSIIIHELIHQKIGNDKGHGREFRKEMKIRGLEGRPTATYPGAELTARLYDLRSQIGDMPVAQLTRTKGKVQSTRLLKVVCECDEPRILRLSRKQIGLGAIICGICEQEYQEVPE